VIFLRLNGLVFERMIQVANTGAFEPVSSRYAAVSYQVI
jgi:hypothetical protein